MLHNIKKELNECFKEFLNMKTLCLVLLTMLAVVAIAEYNYLVYRNTVATKYIQELEEAIGADGTVVGDVCGGDGYVEWHDEM